MSPARLLSGTIRHGLWRWFGVNVAYSPDTIVGEPGGGNVISGNGLGTVNSANVILSDSSGSVVQSNFIGTDITGTVALSTTTYSASLSSSGHTRSADSRRRRARDWATSSRAMGSAFTWSDHTAAPRPSIEGNIIGADATGEHAVPNRNGGISLAEVSLVTIGGTAAGAGNLISGTTSTARQRLPVRLDA